MLRITNQKVAESWYLGKVAKTDHLYTDGVTIWSYGRHFSIATIKFLVEGHKIYFNVDKYSIVEVNTEQLQKLIKE